MPREPRPGRELPDVLEQGRGTRRVFESQQLVESERVDLAGGAARRENALYFRGEVQTSPVQTVEERLDPNAVTHQQQGFLPVIPERYRKHPIQSRDELQAVLVVQVRNDLAVAVAAEPVSFGEQLTAQLTVVVNLTVEDDMYGAGFVRDRLRACDQIDHGQTAHSQADPRGDVYTVAIGTAMAHDIAHRADELARRCRAFGCHPRYAAHRSSSRPMALAKLHADLVAYESQWRLQDREALQRRAL